MTSIINPAAAPLVLRGSVFEEIEKKNSLINLLIIYQANVRIKQKLNVNKELVKIAKMSKLTKFYDFSRLTLSH